MRRVLNLMFLALIVLLPQITQAATGELKLLSNEGIVIRTLTPFADLGGRANSVAAGDLGSDGVSEIIVGAGNGLKPLVRIFRQDGSQLIEFLAYGEGFRGGVNVATCDLNSDGTNEIITGAGYSGGPQIRVFNNVGSFIGPQFFAYSEAFRGGVHVACGDVDGDGEVEVVTGAGPGGGPHIKVFSAAGMLETEIFNGSAFESVGANIAVGDMTGDGVTDIIASPAAYAVPQVTVFAIKNNTLRFVSSIPSSTTATHGSSLASTDIDSDGVAELLVTSGAYTTGSVTPFEAIGTAHDSIALGDDMTGGWAVTSLPEDPETLVVAATTSALATTANDKYIKVDISEQRLTAYANGVPVNTFLVSTGVYGWDTPLGKTTITNKIPLMDYGWNYGVNNPNNYFLPDVQYNLRFRPHYYIHSAYWHNNFGHRMSHGCVNTSLKDAEWTYNWADVGTTVEIVP